MKRVVVFGIFDGVHDGHRSLFAQAKEHGNELVVIVGRDSASLKWKNKKPRHSEQERLAMVRQEPLVDKALLGDREQGTYKVLEELRPEAICLGYDQEKLQEDLEQWLEAKRVSCFLVRLKPHNPKTFHNSHL